MEIIDNRGLLLNVRNPEKITAAIPTSKQLDQHKVLVKWGIDEARVLRNLNIKNVPSPIHAQYDWPGQVKPFKHQKTTAAFFTMNPRSFCFNEQGCVDSETEYLSPEGWVKIREYTGGEVAQYNPDTRTAEFVEPEEYVKLPCKNMVRIKTKYGLDQLLSPEHRVLLEDGKRGTVHTKTETVSAQELMMRHDAYHNGFKHKVGGTKSGTNTIAFSAATIPTNFKLVGGTGVALSDPQLRLQVAVIADGHFSSQTNRCTIRLKKDRKKQRLRMLLTNAGIEYTEKPCKPEGFSRFAFYAPLRCKEFDARFWQATIPQRAIIADEVLHWDGCVTRGERFSTSSKASADFVQFVFNSRGTKSGETARISYRERHGSTEYTVQIRRNTDRLFLRSSGPSVYPESSTDGYKYCFRVPSTYLLFRRNGCVFASGNTGKTMSAIWAADYLMTQGKIRRALIICPLSIMDSAWRADLFKVAMHRTVDVAHGSREKRKEIIEGDAEFVIINYDGVEIVRNEIANSGFDLFIVDEATHYKNAQSNRWKALNSLLRPESWLWMMTGTPAAQSPLDAYGLAKLINNKRVPRFFGAFRDMVMYKVTQFKWVPKETATEIVFDVLQPAIRFTKEQCMDLPEMTYTKRDVELTPQQKRYYEAIRKHMVTVAAGEQITAANAAVNMNKLLQISCGAVYADNGETVEFDIKKRYRVLKEVIDESSQKVLIFVPFKHAIDMLAEKLDSDNITNAIIRGDVPAAKRTEIFNTFQTTPDPRVLIIQPQSAAHGVTLTAANTIVWWGPVSSLETYAQANARVHRSGQKHPCTVVQLVGSSIEKRIYSMLDSRIDVHSKIVDLYQEILES